MRVTTTVLRAEDQDIDVFWSMESSHCESESLDDLESLEDYRVPLLESSHIPSDASDDSSTELLYQECCAVEYSHLHTYLVALHINNSQAKSLYVGSGNVDECGGLRHLNRKN